MNEKTNPILQFSYDPNGNVVTRSDALHHKVKYEYNAQNQLIAVKYPDKSLISFEYNPLGQRTKMIDSIGTTTYEYDIHGRLAKVTDPNNNSMQYTYDPRNLISQMIYPDGGSSSFTWNADSQLDSVKDSSGTTIYKYDLSGNVTKRILPNGVASQYIYDKDNRMTGIKHISSNGDLLLGFEYQYDAAGNRTQVTQIDGTVINVTHYKFDTLNRVKEIIYTDGEKVTNQYNAIGNLTSKVSSKFGETDYSYNNLEQLVKVNSPDGKITFSYDANNNIVELTNQKLKQTTNFYWNFENQLIGLQSGKSKIIYNYDGNGNLVSKQGPNSTINYFPNPISTSGSIMALSDNSDSRRITNFYGNTLLGNQDNNGDNRFFLDDGFGSIYKVVDDKEQEVNSQDFSPLLDLTTIEANAYQDMIEEMGGYVRSLEFELTNIPYIRQYGTAETFFFDIRGLYFLTHDRTNIPDWVPGWVTGPVGPQALLSTPANHFVMAWDLLKGQRNLPFSISTKPINRLYDDGFSTKYTTGFQTVEKYYSSTAPNYPLNRAYGYDPYTDTISITTHSYSQTLENTGFIFDGWTIPNLQTNSASLISKEDLDNAVMHNELLIPPSEDNDFWRRRRETGGEPPDFPPPPPLPVPVGGVSLDKAAEVLVNLTDFTGASYNPKTGEIMLIGRKNLSLPPMNMDDLVVAIRSIYGNGENPGVTMYPVDPTMKDITQKVEYFGGTANTHFGAVMFEADRYLKSLAAGKDTLTGQSVNPKVPGYKSELDLGFEMKTETPWHRNWFVPGKIVLNQSKDGHSMVFEQADIILQSRFVEFLPDGTLQDITGNSPVTDQFTQFMNAHYNEFAATKPELAELVQLAKIVGFVRWLHDNNIPVDLSWVNDYQVTYVKTPETTPGIVTERSDGSYTITSMGGVGYDTDNSYTEVTDPELQTEIKTVADSRPANNPISWEVKSGDETLTAVAFNTAPTSILGGFSTSATDLVIPTLNGQKISFTRQYNSLDLRDSILGRGWSVIIPKLSVQNVISQENLNMFYTEIELATGNHRQTYSLSTDGFFHPKDKEVSNELIGITSGDHFTPLSLKENATLLAGSGMEPFNLINEQGIAMEYDGFAMVNQDGSVMAFDSRGRIIAQRDRQGNPIYYSYERDQISSISDSAGRDLQFSYDSNNHLIDLAATNGQSVHFAYNTANLLSAVTDESGSQLAAYAYGSDNRLNQVTNHYGQLVKLDFDGLGRIISRDSPFGNWSVAYNDQTNNTTYTNSNANTINRQYDERNRLKSETVSGATASYQYDDQDNITSFTDFLGNTTKYNYDERGNLTETVSPLGARTVLWGYNNFGLPQALIDPSQGITLYQYDDQGRLVSTKTGLHLNDMKPDGSFNYQEVDPQVTNYSYDDSGNLATIKNASGSITQLSYDPLGNLTSLQLPGGALIQRTFDDNSQLTSISDPNGYRVDFGYDPQGQLVNISTPTGQTQYQYNHGLIVAAIDPLRNTTYYGYDDVGKLINVINPDGSKTGYEYDETGNVSAVTNAQGMRIEYQYDIFGRLQGIYR